MRRFVQLVTAIFVIAAPSMAQDILDGFIGRVHKSGTQAIPYRVFVPKGYDPSKQYPLVLWLHGAGSVGRDNRKQITQASTAGTHTWTRPENQAKYPAFVVAPQCCSFGSSWNSPRELDGVLEILAGLQKEFSIDAKRLYVAGQSMGGYGTWALIAYRQGMFAAALPLCGGGRESDAPLLVRTPVWAFHGAIDRTVSVWESRKMIDAIKKSGGTPRYTEYPGVGHDVWERTFKEPGLLDWVFAQHL